MGKRVQCEVEELECEACHVYLSSACVEEPALESRPPSNESGEFE